MDGKFWICLASKKAMRSGFSSCDPRAILWVVIKFLIEETLSAKAIWGNCHWSGNFICFHQCDKNHLSRDTLQRQLGNQLLCSHPLIPPHACNPNHIGYHTLRMWSHFASHRKKDLACQAPTYIILLNLFSSLEGH